MKSGQTLLNGGEVIVFSKDSFLDLTLLGQLLQKKQVSIMFTTTALFNAIVDQSPDILSSLRVVLFGGEAVNVDKVNKFIESKNKNSINSCLWAYRINYICDTSFGRYGQGD